MSGEGSDTNDVNVGDNNSVVVNAAVTPVGNDTVEVNISNSNDDAVAITIDQNNSNDKVVSSSVAVGATTGAEENIPARQVTFNDTSASKAGGDEEIKRALTQNNNDGGKSIFEIEIEAKERHDDNHQPEHHNTTGGWRDRHKSGKYDADEIKHRHSQRISAKNPNATTPTNAATHATTGGDLQTKKSMNRAFQDEAIRPQLEILPDGDLGARIVVGGYGAAPNIVEVFGGADDDETAFIEAADVQQIEIELAAEDGARAINVDLSKEYQKPDINRALEYRRRHTPHKRNGEPFSVWKARTGRYVPKRLQRCDLFCEGRKSDFAVYGPGISNYFKYQKWLGHVMFFMFIIQIPAIVVNITGGTYFTKHGFPFAQTTLGNMFIDINTTELVVDTLQGDLNLDNFTYTVTIPGICAHGAYGCAFPRAKILEFYSILDVAGCLFFLFCLNYAELFSSLEMKLYRNKVPKIEDYTIQVVSIPPGADDRALAEHFEDVVGAEVYDVQIVESTGNAIQLCVLRGKLLKRTARMDARIKVLQKNGASEEVIEKYQKRFDKLQKRIDDIDERAKKHSEKGGALMAYVTFESKAAYKKCLKMYDVLWLCGKQPNHLRFRGQDKESDMVIRPAPSPSTLLWENNEYSRANKCMRSTIALIGLFIILLFTVLLSYFVDQYRALAQVTQFTGSTNKLCDGQYDALSIQAGAAQANLDGNLECFCDYHFFQVALDETTDDFLFVKGGLCETLYNTRAGDFALQIGISFVIVLINIFIYRFIINTSGFQKFVSVNDREIHVLERIFIITFVNTGLITLVVNLDWNTYLGININYNFVVNNQVVSLLKSGSFTDFEPAWYSKVGVEIFLISILNIFGPHVYPISMMIYTYLRRRFSTPISQQELNELYLGDEFALSVRHAQSLMMVFFTLMYSSGIPILYGIAAISSFVAYWVDKIFFTKLSRTPPQYTCDLADWATSLMRYGVVLHCLMGAWMYSSPKTFPKTADDLKEGILDELLKDNQIDVNDYKNALPVSSNPFLNSMITRLTLPEALLPLLLALLIIVWKILKRFSFFIRILQNIFHFLQRTFRTCMHSTFADIVVNDVDIPFSNALKEDKLVGLQSYNILANPVYQEALQFHPEVGEDGAGNVAGFHSLADALQFGKSTTGSKAGGNGSPDTKSLNHIGKTKSVMSGSSSGKKDENAADDVLPLAVARTISVAGADDGDNKSVASSKGGRPVAASIASEGSSGSRDRANTLRKGREWETRSKTKSKTKSTRRVDDAASIAPSNAS